MDVAVTLLGDFAVNVGAAPVDPAQWRRRQAATLVKVLALAPGRVLHREQVIDVLWPELSVDEAAPRLHKAAHYARRALGDPGSLVLAGESVALFPRRDVVVDAQRFETLALAAIAAKDPAGAAKAADAYRGELLPHDRYDPWAEQARDRLQLLHLDVLRLAGRWDVVSTLDPTDEEAHLRIVGEFMRNGERRAALRQFERLERALRQELGVAPSPKAVALRDQLRAAEGSAAEPLAAGGAAVDASISTPPVLIARDGECAQVGLLLDTVSAGCGQTLFLCGPAAIGKTALLAWLEDAAAERGFRVGSGVAAHIEGAWPYAPVLEALADLSRRHPALLAGLDDSLRTSIENALTGREASRSAFAGHQRLFVAAAELLRLAASGSGAVLVVDDAHHADDASLRLMHYLARSTATDRVLLVLAHRPQVPAELAQVRQSLLGRRAAAAVDLQPLGFSDVVTPVSQLPSALTDRQRQALAAAAVVGSGFDTDEFLAVACMPEDASYEVLDVAVAHQLLVRTDTGYLFRNPQSREALLESQLPSQTRALHRQAADALQALGRSPARIGHHLIQAGDRAAALRWMLRAAETSAAIGAYPEALSTLESVRAQAEGEDLARLLALRADLLWAGADAAAVDAYRDALAAATDSAGRLLLRARLAQAATVAGDLETAAIALDGLVTDGSPNDTELLLAQGKLAFFQGDFEAAGAAVSKARRRMTLARPDDWQTSDLLGLQGLLAHNSGEWFQRLRSELRTGARRPALAARLFDSHLCVAEFLLYGPTPYAEVLELAAALRETARQSGVQRAVAFATALRGETALLMGDLELASRELQEAADLHHDIGSAAGEAHSLQRLAEVKLARGERLDANRLLHRALPLARFTGIGKHLLQRVYGTMIEAAEDPAAARAIVDQAEGALGVEDYCPFCVIMLAVPSARACADVGDREDAQRHLEEAEKSAGLWEGTAWQAAILETKAHLAATGGDEVTAQQLQVRAAELFEVSGQPMDAERCRISRCASRSRVAAVTASTA